METDPERRAAENLCASVDSLIIGVQMALQDARALVGAQQYSNLTARLQYSRNCLFEVKSELMDFGVNAVATPKMPPDEGDAERVPQPAG